MFKDRRVIFLVVLAAVALILFCVLNFKSSSDKLESYIKNMGFSLEDGLYTKVLSDVDLEEYYRRVDTLKDVNYEVLYFDINNFQLLKTGMDYVDGITYIFNPLYDYKNNSLVYDYEISIDNTQILLEGEYDANTEKFTCGLVDYQKINLSDSDKELMCNRAELDVSKFMDEVRELFNGTDFLK